ncbi:maleylpyruvate isomerase family mycothiol-dependent enzyme [Arthrobacter caoxuetaonis]|uniref:Maleylpyruvate isomerase family mycothiol-dependent enzyme n=1 Tax=Arthrobacter caoxuetaonis TaxID=2886935 RepID=A0A9X1MFD4_9MICC|nr:maleylpyruvate isomerase family mycothiol-dependent enzyme [Arthrobacter caoxuetaonis]MCC3299064.1 maleylpyruvate isomerase family mycothiol-dependent enzyme [Arthrobacter caoxuetaonis]USQ58600.1 maleylpyruvate isomerase family mycothiol-dependent enzyme [Arthrobacter caoxuetaonis]
MTPQPASSIWSAVHEERRALIQDLENLSAAQWQTPSLCPGWDVHDVLAHLVDTAKTTRLGFIRRLLAARMDFDRDNTAGVFRERAQDPQITLAAFRSVQSRKSGPPVPLATRLVEAVVHGEDIRRPLGIVRTYPVAPVLAALQHQLKTSVKIGGGKELVDGLRLVATDGPFELGRGDEVRGSSVALLLTVSGRPVRDDELDGGGSGALLKRCSTS